MSESSTMNSVLLRSLDSAHASCEMDVAVICANDLNVSDVISQADARLALLSSLSPGSSIPWYTETPRPELSFSTEVESEDMQEATDRLLGHKFVSAHVPQSPILFDDNAGTSSLPSLNYGSEVDRCLWRARRFGHTSTPCAAALDTVNDAHTVLQKQYIREEQIDSVLAQVNSMIFPVAGISLLTMIISFMALVHIYCNRGEKTEQNERVKLTRNVMNAVYNNPALESEVEACIGQEIGDELDSSSHILVEGKTVGVYDVRKETIRDARGSYMGVTGIHFHEIF